MRNGFQIEDGDDMLSVHHRALVCGLAISETTYAIEEMLKLIFIIARKPFRKARLCERLRKNCQKMFALSDMSKDWTVKLKGDGD